jgi:hypothetical protein
MIQELRFYPMFKLDNRLPYTIDIHLKTETVTMIHKIPPGKTMDNYSLNLSHDTTIEVEIPEKGIF